MPKLHAWLLFLAPTIASPHQLLRADPANVGRYVLDGQATRTKAKAYEEADGPTIKLGIPPAGPQQEVFYVKFTKRPGSAPDADAYQVAFISYSYTTATGVQGVNYDGEVRGTLRKTASGGYSGTFGGTCPARASATGKISIVSGTFTNVHPAAARQR